MQAMQIDFTNNCCHVPIIVKLTYLFRVCLASDMPEIIAYTPQIS